MLPGAEENKEEFYLFPILRGESVGVDGEFSGHVFIVKSAEDLRAEWTSDHIVVLSKDLESYFIERPIEANRLLDEVSAVVSEFDEPIGEFSAAAYEKEAICLVKVHDAVRVLENNMHIRIVANESRGDVFFID